jgi:hypothetical protein
MNDPLTTRDPRNSPPDGVGTSWEETRRVLETADLFWISTVRTDGRPHVTPLVAVWHDGALHLSAKDTAQQTANRRATPHVSLTTGSNQVLGLRVVVQGDAVRSTEQEPLERFAAVWATKWDGASWLYQVRNGSFCLSDEDARVIVDANLVFSVLPTQVFAFGTGQTRHQCSPLASPCDRAWPRAVAPEGTRRRANRHPLAHPCSPDRTRRA